MLIKDIWKEGPLKEGTEFTLFQYFWWYDFSSAEPRGRNKGAVKSFS